MPPLLEIRHISKAFPGVQALDDVSLSLDRGEVLAVVGENGAGKSTLMKILAGVYSADAGDVLLDERKVRIRTVNDAIQLGISLIHQELNLAENLSVAANLFLGREMLLGGPLGFLRQRQMNADARILLQQVGLDCSPQAIVGSLSPGRRQLVEIARALSMDVRILIMDEPTSSLTQRETDKLYEVINDLRRQNVSVVYISHRLAEVEQIADRVVVLRDGRYAGELTRGNGRQTPSIAITQSPATAVAGSAPPQTPSTAIPDTRYISHDAMVRLMVGRELDQFFQRKHSADSENVRLELCDLRYRGVPGHGAGISEPISFFIREGEILGMAGLVGAGRTELAEAVFGLRPVVAGQIRIDGKAVSLSTPRHAIDAGVLLVPEDRRRHGLVLADNVRRNIGLPNLDLLDIAKMISPHRERGLAQKMCAQLHVRTPSIGKTVGLLSGGNQQKVVLAKWLARNPQVLIVDEPTRGIDVGAKSEIYALLDELAGDGVAIWMISSDLEEILGMSDRVAVLHDGRLAGVLDRDNLAEQAIMQLATGGGGDRQ